MDVRELNRVARAWFNEMDYQRNQYLLYDSNDGMLRFSKLLADGPFTTNENGEIVERIQSPAR